MIPPTTTGTSTPSSRSWRITSGTSSRCDPERIDRPTTSTSSSLAAAAIWAGRQADALVDDLEAGVPGGHGDLLGAVGVPVEARLGHQQLRRAAEESPERPDPDVDLGQLGAPEAGRAGHAGRGPVLAEDLPQGRRPLPGRAAGVGEGDGRRHDVVVALGRPAQPVQGLADCIAVPGGPPLPDVGDEGRLDAGVDPQDGALAAEGGVLRGGEPVDPDDRQVARLDAPGALHLATHQAALQLLDGLEGAAERQHVGELLPGLVHERGGALPR